MNIRNMYDTTPRDLLSCHGGDGVLRHVNVYDKADFQSKLKFVNYTVLPPGTTIGYHQHADNEEMYVILEGTGTMTIDGESTPVKTGDVILNRPYGAHGLQNDSDSDLKLLVFEAGM